MELLNVITVDEAKALIEDNFSNVRPGTETVPVFKAAGRYLATEIRTLEPVPMFRRSTKDGYALRSADVSGASETLPAFLKLTGAVEMGRAADLEIGRAEAAYVPTGGMIPAGADAVVMIEYCEMLTDSELAVYRAARVKENIINSGEDMEGRYAGFHSGQAHEACRPRGTYVLRRHFG